MKKMNKKKRLKIVLIIVLVLAAMSTLSGFIGSSTMILGPAKTVAVIQIHGEIGEASSGILSSSSNTASPSKIAELLDEALADERVVAIVLDVRSPGGGAAVVQGLVRSVEAASAQKPTVTMISEYGFSGALWISASSNWTIIAPLALTGSLGVISEFYEASGFMEKYGFGHQVVKSGEYKDVGSIGRNLTEEELEWFQNLSDTVYHEIVSDIAGKRGMNVSELEPLAQGQLFLGVQAKSLGLVDEVGYFADAVRAAGTLAEVSEPNYRVFASDVEFTDLLAKLGVSTLLQDWMGNNNLLFSRTIASTLRT